MAISYSGDGCCSGLPALARAAAHYLALLVSVDTIKAAARETLGEIVALKGSGEPFNHITKFHEAREGAANALKQLKRLASDGRVPPVVRERARKLLREFSKRLDQAEALFESTINKLNKE